MRANTEMMLESGKWKNSGREKFGSNEKKPCRVIMRDDTLDLLSAKSSQRTFCAVCPSDRNLTCRTIPTMLSKFVKSLIWQSCSPLSFRWLGIFDTLFLSEHIRRLSANTTFWTGLWSDYRNVPCCLFAMPRESWSGAVRESFET
jgi:hypothetical protein